MIIISGRYEDKYTIFTNLRERISSCNAKNKHTLHTHNLANNLHTIKYKLLLATCFRMADCTWPMAAVHPRQDLQIVNAIKSSHVILVKRSGRWRFKSSEMWLCICGRIFPNHTTSHLIRHEYSAAPVWEPLSRKDLVLHLIQQKFTVDHFRIHQHIMRAGEYTLWFHHFESPACNNTKRLSTSVGEVYAPVCDECTVTAVPILKWRQINTMQYNIFHSLFVNHVYFQVMGMSCTGIKF